MITTTLILWALCAFGIGLVISRVKHLAPGETKASIFYQHFALGMGLVCGMLLPEPYARPALAGAIVAFLFIGGRMWKYAAPLWAYRPDFLDSQPMPMRRQSDPPELNAAQMRHVQGRGPIHH